MQLELRFYPVLSVLKDIYPIVSTYCVCVCVLSYVQLFATPGTVAHHAPLSMKISRQEYWSELPFPTPGSLTNPGIKPVFLVSPALAGKFFTTEPLGKPKYLLNIY